MRESPSGKASAFQADIRGFESHLPLSGSVISYQSTVISYWSLITDYFFHWKRGPVAQWLAQGTHNSLVAGSNPAGPTFDLRFSILD
jgi:hypothetical protein